jgi:hypothetical protein
MEAFFTELGDRVLERWKRANFSLEKFPAIAVTALEERRPSDHVDLAQLMRNYLLNDAQPLQTQAGFGQPELIAYDHPRFYIQLLFWLDGTTDIHQHEFSGAFHVMHGSSIHAHYDFLNGKTVTPHIRVGDVKMKNIELLETGRTVPIISGTRCIHSLFHLDNPSVTVVLRTQHDPGTGPQYNYLPPHVAMDPMHVDTLTMRRKQLLDVLEQMEDPTYADLVLQMLAELDFERGFFILQHAMARLRDLGQWTQALKVFRKKHGSLASGVAATLEEGLRRDIIKNMRAAITDSEHRFFLALLMNVPTSRDLLRLVAKRFADTKPQLTVLRWAEEMLGFSEEGAAILDAQCPATLGIDEEHQPALMLGALQHLMQPTARMSEELQALSPQQLKHLHSAFIRSSLRVLLP